MAPKTPLSPPLDWHVQYDDGLAVAYRLDAPNWLVLYAFARLESGLVDLVAFRCDPYTRPVAELPDAVEKIVEVWGFDLPAKGLTVNQLRVSLTGGDMLTKAREQLRDKIVHLLPARGIVRRGRLESAERDDAFYARLAVVYSELIVRYGARGGARQHLGAALGEKWAGINTVKEWIKKAEKRGFWITDGRSGRPGDASPRARAIYEGTNQ